MVLRRQELSVLLDFNRLREVLSQAAAGDLSVRTGIAYDESLLGQLAQAIDHLLGTFARHAKELQTTIDALSLLFEANPLAIGIYDPQGHQIRVNAKMCELLGYTEEELAEIDPTHPDDREEGVRLWQELVAGKREMYRREKRYIRKDGTVIWADLTAVALRDESGKTQFLVTMVQDITERKRMEQALQESEERFRTIVEMSPHPIGIHKGAQWIYVNPAAAEASGYSREELLTMNFWEIVHPEAQEQVRRRSLSILRGEPVPPRNQVKVVKKTGEEGWVDYIAVPIKLQGEAAVLVIAHDITELKRLNEALERRNRRLELLRSIDKAILSATPLDEIVRLVFGQLRSLVPCTLVSVSVFDWDQMEMEFLVENAVGQKAIGTGSRFPLQGIEPFLASLSSGEVVCIPNLDDLEQLPHFLEILRQVGIRSVLLVPLQVNGNLYGSLNLGADQPNAFAPEHVEVAVEVGYQLSVAFLQERLREELLRYAEELEELVAERTQELRETNERLENFVASLAHDFHAPLTTIYGFAKAALEDYGDRLDETGRDLLQRIVRSSERLSQLVSDLRTYTLVRRSELRLQIVDLNEVIRIVLEQLTALREERNAQVHIASPLPLVKGQEALLVQVFQNLIANAIKSVPRDRVPQVRVWAESEGEWVRIWVEDNGAGIPPEDREHIFRPFERLRRAEYAGLGLGLALVRTAVERMNGRVGVESELGKGSRFWVELQRA